MRQQTELLAGVTAYQQHDYLTALKHFALVKEAWQSDKQQAVIETLIGVSNLQLCNYNEAAKTLHRVRDRLAQFQDKEFVGSELLVVKCKVITNLLILELLNCSQAASNRLQQLLQLISSAAKRSRSAALALFKVILKSLFGFQTFAEINALLTQLLDNRNHLASFSINSPVYLTAISIYAHLSGQHRQAYKLQLLSYDLSKDKHSLLAALSLRHLQQLCVQLKDEANHKKFQRDLKKLMSGELEGVAEQTLFRNYDKKLQLASGIVAELIREENELTRLEVQEGVQKLAVVWKLQTMQKNQRNSRIVQVLQLMKQSRDIISVMDGNQFVKEAVKDYKAAVKHLTSIIQNVGKKVFFNAVLKLPKNSHERNDRQGIRYDKKMYQPVSEEQFQELSASKANRSFDSNSSSNKRHKEYATSFYLPKQSKLASISDNRSNLVVNRHKKNQTQVNSHRDKDNAIYRIAKPGHPTKEQRSKVNQLPNQSDHDTREIYTSKQNKSILRAQKKQVVLSKKDIQREPDRRQLYKRQQQVNVPLLQEISNSKIKEVPLVDQKPRQLVKTVSNRIQQNKASEIKLITQHTKQSKPFPSNFSNLTNQKFPPANDREYYISNLKGRRADPPAGGSIIARQTLHKKLPKLLVQCQSGQFIQKRHFTSDGGAQRFVKVSKQRDKIAWADSEEAIDFSSHSASYSMNDIRGIVYGKVTQTMRKECNAKLDPTKCFSLILKKRTLDFYCPKEVDIFFWLPGISICLKDFIFQNENYSSAKKSKSKLEKRMCNKVYFDDREVSRYYSVGRVLWRRFLMRVRSEFAGEKKKEKYRSYKNPNAFAIVAAAVKKMNFKTVLPHLS